MKRIGFRLLGCGLFGAVLASGPAAAVVGPTLEPGPLAAHVVMVLERSAAGAGFCSGVVVAPDVVLTAAHCVVRAADTRVHFKDASGQPVLVGVSDVATHPGFRHDAVRRRERSIDLALVRLASPLPGRFAPATLDTSRTVTVGQRFRLAGYGLGREDTATTGGVLRVGELAARAPLSAILLWANDPSGSGVGACTGDSGAPVFSDDAAVVVGISTWAAGVGRRNCGDLTQAVLLKPQADWIAKMLRLWGEPPGR